jgi:CubicO group peptidase (beta-lactamase class C family)
MRIRAAAALILSLVGASHGNPAATETWLPEPALTLVRQQRVPQIVWAIARGRDVQARGLSAPGFHDRRDATSLHFHAASVTKPVTATAVLRLVDDRRIQLDQRVIQVLSGLRSQDSRLGKVTIRHLLDHTSGIEDPERGTPPLDGPTSLIEASSRDPVKFHAEPGSSFGYANRNYVLLGAVIEQVTGFSFEEFASRAALRKGGADSATLSCRSVPESQRATGHTLDSAGSVVSSRIEPFGRADAPAGGLCITARELAAWGLRTVAASSRLRSAQAPYGFGWYVEDSEGVRLYQHDGTDVGYAASLIVVPERDLAVAVMSNFTFASAGPIARMLLASLLGAAFEYPDKMPDAAALKRFQGRYVNVEQGSAWIAYEGGELRMTYQQPGFNYEIVDTRLMPKPEWDPLGYYIGTFRGEPIWFAWKAGFSEPVLYLQSRKFVRAAP